MRALLPTLLICATACRSLEITPDALSARSTPGEPSLPAGRPADRTASLARWQDAVALVNEFLASPWRRTLPPGRFELSGFGMTFIMADGQALPIAVASTWWGDLVVASGFRAQEGEDGFCVGKIDVLSTQGDGATAAETPDPLLDHTFFRYGDGRWHDAASLAEVTLHETTHDVYRTGTVGPWNTIGYYVVAAVTFGASADWAEDRPRATSEEFVWFCIARNSAPEYVGTIERVRDEHLAAEHEHCEHGPFP